MLIVLKNTIHKIHRSLRSSMLNRDSGSRVLGYRGNVYIPHQCHSLDVAPYEASRLDSTDI